ncbi:MAG TPA: hypothetical protein VKR27_02555, partial [Acidimicrobiales bacterium]|nr:hypothetical protein [Acidimicrobiales bacterium]
MSPVGQTTLEALARAYLDRQPWFQVTSGGAPPSEISLVSAELLREEPPSLSRLVLSCAGRSFSLFAGWRPATDVAEALHERESAIFGSAVSNGTSVFVYDALADDILAVELLARATKQKVRASRVREVTTLASHASLVYDERYFMKCYRVLEPGTRPEIELLQGLDSVGFNAMLSPIAFWQEDGVDLALVREFLPSALEGRLLAMTSLRDLLARASGYDTRGTVGVQEPEFDPDRVAAAAGGDLASEMRRLGAMAARLHLALDEAFESRRLEADELAASLGPFDESGGGVPVPDALAKALAGIRPGEAGAEIRLHGDFHLRRVMRSETGWVLAGFGDDPLYGSPLAFTSIPAQRGSPAEDLADMSFSIALVAHDALGQRAPAEVDAASRLAEAWTRRNQEAFLQGYSQAPGIEALVPLGVLRQLVGALVAER